MKRIYHSWDKWECYRAGMYSSAKINNVLLIKKVHHMFNSIELTDIYMDKAINEWVFSMENNLTNTSMNRVAYLGQAACCVYSKIPNISTMLAWKGLHEDVRNRANKQAEEKIKEWELSRRLKSMLMNGKKEIIKKGYQMKLPLNWKEEI